MENSDCPTPVRYLIHTPQGHHVVEGTCLHIGQGRTEVHAKEGEIVAVLYEGGSFVVKTGPAKAC